MFISLLCSFSSRFPLRKHYQGKQPSQGDHKGRQGAGQQRPYYRRSSRGLIHGWLVIAPRQLLLACSLFFILLFQYADEKVEVDREIGVIPVMFGLVLLAGMAGGIGLRVVVRKVLKL